MQRPCAGKCQADGPDRLCQKLRGLKQGSFGFDGDIGPAANAVLAQLSLGAVDSSGRKSRRIFEPVQHRIGGCIPRHGAQQAHQGGSGARGGKLPPGFVAHGHAALTQHGAHAAREQTVLCDQRNRAAPVRQMRQYAGCGPLCFVFGIQGRMQRKCGRDWPIVLDAERNRQ